MAATLEQHHDHEMVYEQFEDIGQQQESTFLACGRSWSLKSCSSV